ncbi:MarR family winged helix-turn-helix transcriptional regulator [Pseudonocardia asaccharolytica]|uniref:Transcriptional regulator n=1 Tax=Pseudonocardia asaccharolytica DSM 44247 = NBRC 16224 TaxID=1123024 RepID=A0A511D5N6_9PSEU|nr:MarR family winged helix-turn-helix transcriptional regulator [Pseudonocardia asaccharolytica]GEL20112.1 transcriptional regulator [Pseudonocardia asaccharolytica DSM 44247 = NBRC 16224]
MAHEPADLDQRLMDAVERLGAAARAMLRRSALAEGLSLTQAQLLLRITADTAPPQGTGSLAGWLEVSAPTVSDAIQTLVRKGMVERGLRSGRAWTATAIGRAVARRLRRWQDPLRAALGGQPDAAKATALETLLHTIAELNVGGHISTARTCLTCRFFRADPEAWCALLETALAPADLRVDCPEHEPRTSA